MTTRQDVQDLRDQGANLINASYPGLFTQQPPYQVDLTALKYLDDLVRWADQVGLYVVIHFRTGPGRNMNDPRWDGPQLVDLWSSQSAHDAWVAMWRFTAERYRDSPVVVGYNLMVEPHPNTLVDPDWELTPAQYRKKVEGTLMDWNALAADISAGIREVDPDTPIIINSLQWASPAWFSVLEPTGDPRTVYSPHGYDPDDYTHQDISEVSISYPDRVAVDGETIVFDRAWLVENYRVVREFAERYDVPIYVGEYGLMRWVPNGPAFLQDLTALFEQHGWNHAVYVWRGEEAGFDGFTMEYGTDPDCHTRLPGNPLMGVLRGRWALNTDFPG